MADAGPWSGKEKTSAWDTLDSASDCDHGHEPIPLWASGSSAK